jgi:hypothetical protein
MIRGYLLTGHDNDSYMLGNETRRAVTAEERQFFDWRFTYNGGQHPATCPCCGRKIDNNYINPNFELRKKRMDIGTTYDGYTIVSDRFREFIEAQKVSEIDFVSLPSQSKHYWLLPRKVLVVDQTRSQGLRLMYPCQVCGANAGIFGTTGLRFVGINEEIPEGIFRSDLEFGQAHAQHHLIIVSSQMVTAMKSQKFEGLSLTEI